jgi:formylglycine-generating enzyme required for sulfatase activity
MALGKQLFLISLYIIGGLPKLVSQIAAAQSDATASQANALVTFVTEPPGSSVQVDGKPLQGHTPLTASLPPASTNVKFVPWQEGYRSMTAAFSWHAGESKRIEVHLPKAYGNLCLATSRPWAALQLDHVPFPAKANACERLQAGMHTLIASEGRYAAIAKVHLSKGARLTVDLRWRTISPDPARFAFIQRAKARIGLSAYADFNPPRSVELKSFWIQRNEVTVHEYHECVQTGRCSPPAAMENCNWNLDDREEHPVNCVSPLQALEYAKWFSVKDGLAYRLPTGSEWEYVATAEGKQLYPWGSDSPQQRCNTCDRSCDWRWHDTTIDDGWPQTSPVGKFKMCSGADHIYDLIGNVAEWCSKRNSELFDLRGGSWASPSTLYDPLSPNIKPRTFADATTGFRLAATAISVEILENLGSRGAR